MLELKTKQQLARDAFNLAQGTHLVRHNNVTYIPADFETLETAVPPDIDRTIWLPLDRFKIQRMAATQYDTLFANDNELATFDYMVGQHANQVDKEISTLLVRTPGGLRELSEDGLLVTPSQEFRPNTLIPMLNEDPAEKTRVFDVIEEWLQSEEEAESLLRHLATCLAPGWSAVKYVLLLGEGRNGKGVLMKMLKGLFGDENTSSITRQDISTGSPVTCELNGKLLNLVFDGQHTYVKDSGLEKSLVAGEPVSIRRLYESSSTRVQTNALFIEGLNREPKTGDKSSALQKRLVRYQFPNVYALSHGFQRTMLREETVGAFLSMLIDRYVREDEVAHWLAPTAKGLELQLEQMYANSLGLQFLKHLEESDALGAAGVLGESIDQVAQRFASWRVKENDLGSWAEPDIVALLTPLVNTERRSKRVVGQVKKIKVVTSFREEAAAFIKSLEGEDSGTTVQEVQGDGSQRVREEGDSADCDVS